MFLFHEAAGRVSGTAGLGIAHVPSWIGNSPAELLLQGRDLLQPGHTEATGFVTGPLGHIALVAFGAAVLVIVAAHSLERNKERVLHQTEILRNITGCSSVDETAGKLSSFYLTP